MTNEEILKDQIGAMGGEPEGLGKLNHIPGQKEELSESEKNSLEKFKQTTRSSHIRLYESNDIVDGWFPIDRSELGIRSQFYPKDWEFRVRPATVEAIKNWSTVDEDHPVTIQHVMNEIIRTCVSIYSDRGRESWDKINSWDRFWFILKVREYTFANGEQRLEFDEECDNCGYMLHYVLESNQLYYEFPDADVIERHWNQDKMYWDIVPAEYDIEGYAPMKLYVPTIQKDQAILNWLYEQQQSGKDISVVFIRFLPYMLEFAPKDPAWLDKNIKEAYREFKNWDTEMFLFMGEVIKNIALNPMEKLITKCPGCGEEVHTTVQFPNGIKYLFAVQSKHRKFGSK